MVYHATKSCEKEARFNKYSVEITKALCLGLADCNWSIKYESCVAAGADMSKAVSITLQALQNIDILFYFISLIFCLILQLSFAAMRSVVPLFLNKRRCDDDDL